jgi:predicted aspartyl protease
MDSIECPRCNSRPPAVNVIGNTVICTCGWHGPLNHRQIQQRARLKRLATYVFMVFLLGVLAFLGVEYKRWGRFTGNYLFTHAKAIIGKDHLVDWQNLGLSCQILERFDCMESSFRKVLEKEPDQQFALQNIGIAQVGTGDFESAARNFQKLFDEGTNSPESMYYYGKAMQGLGKTKESKTWFYRTLAAYPGFVDVADELVDLLVDEEEYFEALSVLGSMTHLMPRVPHFKGRIFAVSDLAAKKSSNQRHRSIRLAAVQDHHFLPVRIGPMTSPEMFLVDTGATKLTLSPDFLYKNNIRDFKIARRARVTLADGSQQAATLIILPKISIGPWEIRNVEATLCEGCTLLAGKSILKHFRTSTKNERGVEYLQLVR